MAITVVQTATGTGNPPVTFASNVTAGNTVILIAPCYNTSGSSNTITSVLLGGSAVPGTVAFFNPGTTGTVNSPTGSGNVASIAIWMLPDCPGGQKTVDYTPSASQVGQVAFEIAGLGTSPSLDQSSSGGSTTGSTSDSGTTAAITTSPEIIIGAAMIFSGAGASSPAGFTVSNPTGDAWAGYQIVTSSGGTYHWTQTGAGDPWAAAIATVKGTPAPPVLAPFYPVTRVRAKLPVPLLTGRKASSPGAPVRNPGVVPVYGAIPGAVRATLPVNPRGRVSSSPGAPVRNPAPGPVFRQKTIPVRFILPRWQPHAGRIGSNSGAAVQNPAHGPPAPALQGPVRARLPQLQPRAGRVNSNAGGPARNPAPSGVGPPLHPFTQPARIRPSLPHRGRTASNPGGPVQNPVPGNTGPPFYPFRAPVRVHPAPPPRGRTTSNPGAPVRNPAQGAAFPASHGPVQARLPQQPFLKGRVTSSPGGPVLNPPAPGPRAYPLQGPVQARHPLPARGRTSGNPGGPVQNPVVLTGPPFYPRRDPARIRPGLPFRGRSSSNPGAPVQNPHAGPVFIQKDWPARARIPQNAPRGRTAGNPGGPVENIPQISLQIRQGTPYTGWSAGTPYTGWSSGTPYA